MLCFCDVWCFGSCGGHIPIQCGENFEAPKTLFPVEVEEEDALPSCFSSQTVNTVSLPQSV